MKAGSSCTETEEDTLLELLRVLFPGSVLLGSGGHESLREASYSGRKRALAMREAGQLFAPNKVTWGTDGFSPHKALAVDRIYLALLQREIEVLLESRTSLFRLSFGLKYTPTSWRRDRVVFLPKGGNRNSTLPKSYRHISLTSFTVNIVEKVVDRHIRDEVLLASPLCHNQHAYISGKSTVTALAAVVGEEESSLANKEVITCVFTDTKVMLIILHIC